MNRTVALVPAKDRSDLVGATVRALSTVEGLDEILVIDDGSSDATGEIAEAAGATVVTLAENEGKGAALAAGVNASGAAGVYLLIDADLGDSAALADRLLAPVQTGEADLAIAEFPVSGRSRGFGLVKRMARALLHHRSGRWFAEPLSGQRAITGSALRAMELAPRFGVEVAMTLDAIDAGLTIVEVPVAFTHRATGRTPSGFLHRARQGLDVLRPAAARLGWSSTLRVAARAIRST